jgi:hypothetical protein
MEYNTEREQLIIPEYGRHVQKMINHATTLSDKVEQQKCVDAIIAFMGQMNPHLRDVKEFTHKLWDHLHIMSDFKLEIESPYAKPEIAKLEERPKKMTYPGNMKKSYILFNESSVDNNMIRLHLKQMSDNQLTLSDDFEFIRSASVRPDGKNSKKKPYKKKPYKKKN